MSIRRFSRSLVALFISQYALMIEYRAEIVLWALSGILPLIMLSIWTEYSINSSFDIDPNVLKHYFIAAFVVRQFTAVWVMITFEEDHLEGRLSSMILQPIHPFWRYLASHVAEQFSRVPIVIVMLLLVFFLIPNSFWIPSFSDLLFSLIAIPLAFLVRFLMHWFFAMLCFWNDRASAIERLLLIPYLFLSGLVAPIETFPTHLKSLAYLTPFPYILSFPAQVLSGQATSIYSGFLSLIIWAVVFYILGRLLWVKGIRQYTGMGA